MGELSSVTYLQSIKSVQLSTSFNYSSGPCLWYELNRHDMQMDAKVIVTMASVWTSGYISHVLTFAVHVSANRLMCTNHENFREEVTRKTQIGLTTAKGKQ